jgi:uncharacterized protein YukE
MDLFVTPDRLARLHDQLTGCAGQLAAVAERVDQLGREPGWQGDAQRAFAAQALRVGGHCAELARRVRADAGKVERCAEQLAEELAVLRRLEHEVLGTLHRLAGRLLDDVTGHVRQVYDDVVRRLPSPGSPDWRPLAADLAAAVLP